MVVPEKKGPTRPTRECACKWFAMIAGSILVLTMAIGVLAMLYIVVSNMFSSNKMRQ